MHYSRDWMFSTSLYRCADLEARLGEQRCVPGAAYALHEVRARATAEAAEGNSLIVADYACLKAGVVTDLCTRPERITGTPAERYLAAEWFRAEMPTPASAGQPVAFDDKEACHDR